MVTQVESDDDPKAQRKGDTFCFDLDQYNYDLHMFDDQIDVAQSDDAQRDVGIEDVDPISQRGVVVRSNKKPQKEPKKPKKREDPIVGVVEKYVEIKTKQAMDKATLLVRSRNVQEFSINKSIVVLYKMESLACDERPMTDKCFKNAENHEIFLTSATDDEQSVVAGLQGEMIELPRGI
uniref:Uncharacterized protein n=1 Tax=Aegilops tauschii TaxID=37682 RepID=M8CW95_AEGTA